MGTIHHNDPTLILLSLLQTAAVIAFIKVYKSGIIYYLHSQFAHCLTKYCYASVLCSIIFLMVNNNENILF